MSRLMVKAAVEMEIYVDSLAEKLASQPEMFAEFWFHFAEIVRRDGLDLEDFGKAMAPAHGAIRKHPFNAITDYMRYYERRAETPWR